MNRPNTFPAQVMAASETPHRITLFLRLHPPLSNHNSSPHSSANIPCDQIYPLQAELFRDKWKSLEENPMPWHVYLAPEKILLLSEDMEETIGQPDLWRTRLKVDNSKIMPKCKTVDDNGPVSQNGVKPL